MDKLTELEIENQKLRQQVKELAVHSRKLVFFCSRIMSAWASQAENQIEIKLKRKEFDIVESKIKSLIDN